jgi:ABC-type nitrate/sulfonate/bicarbonate transport system substrate-binding protein
LTLTFNAAILQTGAAQENSPIRLGWQTPWATQGQLVSVLKRTNILELVDVPVEFIGFSYGGPLNTAAVAGEVDIILTADQPALILLAKKPDFRVVARMMYNRTCLYVPAGSAVRSVRELADRTVLGPTGAAAERVALAALRDAGVDLSSVRFGNLDMAQQVALLRSPSAGQSWSNTDALYGFDPFPAMFEEAGKARMLHCGQVVSLVLASGRMLTQRRDQLVRFLKAFDLSWAWFSRNPKSANAWFKNEAGLDVSNAALDVAALVEPNRSAKDVAGVNLDLSASDMTSLDATLQFLRDRALISGSFRLQGAVDLTPLRTALSDTGLERFFAQMEQRPQ